MSGLSSAKTSKTTWTYPMECVGCGAILVGPTSNGGNHAGHGRCKACANRERNRKNSHPCRTCGQPIWAGSQYNECQACRRRRRENRHPVDYTIFLPPDALAHTEPGDAETAARAAAAMHIHRLGGELVANQTARYSIGGIIVSGKAVIGERRAPYVTILDTADWRNRTPRPRKDTTI